MKKTRGMGTPYQPTYTDKKTGQKKTAATWCISYFVHGKRHRESAHSTNRNDAVKLLKQRIGDIQTGKPVGTQLERTTLNDLIAMVQADYQANARKSADRVPYAAAHLREYFGGDTKARDISADRITAYLAHRLDEGAARATANYEQGILHRAFKLAARAGKVATIPLVSMLRTDNARQGFFERDQFDGVISRLPEHLKPLAIAGYLTGWRRGELLSRQWRHVDLKAGWLRLEVGETKNGKGRAFPINALPELAALLQAQRERVSQIERETGKIVPWVFPNADGSHMVDFRKAWRSACRSAGCPGRLFHDFRRTAVRNLERVGVSRSAGMSLTGHLTEAVYRRYAIVDSTMLEEAVAKLASASVHSATESNGPSSAQVTTLPMKRAGKSS